MRSHRRALVRRALGTATAVTLGATAVLVAPASADHAPADKGEECRQYAQVPNPFVKIMAEDNHFDTDCLEAPANRKFRIYFENRDGDAHNISVYSADPSKDKKAEQLYKGKSIKGPGQEEYALDELPAGEYFFRDDKTPGMTGTLSIPKPKK